MSQTAVAVANYFIRKGLQAGKPVDPMKLQKLIYFAHGWHLAVYGRPLINERVEAWAYGPVVPTIYHQVKKNGAAPIEFPIFELGPFGRVPPEVTDDQALALLDRVWKVYGGISSLELSKMSHAHDGPWYQTWHDKAEQGAIRGVDIPDDLIQEYFLADAQKRRARPSGQAGAQKSSS